ncbi:MAG: c-type cytochrome [Planctomycetota bacterium]
MVLPRLALAAAAVVAAATAVHVSTATPPSAEIPAGLAVSARPSPKGVAELYGLHCAQCHGEEGDGDGVTELERPARSFVEGGYIYGNTIAAVTRTLRRGIPGSAMPSFADSLTEHERSLLARHVLSLGPEGTDASPAECLVPTSEVPEVLDGPLMVPGQPLSAPVGDVGLHPSRLLTFPGAPSVQFARGSWALVALRAAGPVRRDDWRRGGRSITASGEVLWGAPSPEATDPGALVTRQDGAAAAKRLRRTRLGAAARA